MFEKLLTDPLTYVALVLIVAFAMGSMYRQVLSGGVRRLLLVAFVAGVALLAYVIFKPGEPPPPKPLLDGELTVPAYQTRGTPFKNYMQFPIKVEFMAGGQWSLSNFPDSVRGPDGRSGEAAGGRYRLPSAPAGSLIMRWGGTDRYELVGTRKVVELKPGQEVMFMINDNKSDKAYADNTGSLKIRWTCFNCLEQ